MALKHERGMLCVFAMHWRPAHRGGRQRTVAKCYYLIHYHMEVFFRKEFVSVAVDIVLYRLRLQDIVGCMLAFNKIVISKLWARPMRTPTSVIVKYSCEM